MTPHEAKVLLKVWNLVYEAYNKLEDLRPAMLDPSEQRTPVWCEHCYPHWEDGKMWWYIRLDGHEHCLHRDCDSCPNCGTRRPG